MHLTISNIAWDNAEEASVFSLLTRYNITGVEIAPTKYFQDFHSISREDTSSLLKYFSSFSLKPIAFQALLFGTSDAFLFGTKEQQASLEQRLKDVIRLGGLLGVPALVFGSPKNRAYGEHWSREHAWEYAAEFFSRLGQYAQEHDTCLCLEPNPASYGTNFLTTTQETATFVQYVNSPGIRLHLDTGTMFMNQETPDQLISQYVHLSPHVHFSLPDLARIQTDSSLAFSPIVTALQQAEYSHWISLEMRRQEPVLPTIENALSTIYPLLSSL